MAILRFVSLDEFFFDEVDKKMMVPLTDFHKLHINLLLRINKSCRKHHEILLSQFTSLSNVNSWRYEFFSINDYRKLQLFFADPFNFYSLTCFLTIT
jgi:hypothetical protein